MWPAVSISESMWTPEPGMFLSHNKRRLNTGVFRISTPARIAELVVELSADTMDAVDKATAAITALGLGRELPFSAVLLRGESASSSQIEHLSASARHIALASFGDKSRRNATQIAGNVAAMQAAIALADQLDVDAILAMHQKLGGGDHPSQAGRFRQEWVWINGDTPVTADYVAPPYREVPSLIDDLIEFLRRDDIDPLVQAAIGHAQFESIHPFVDGNGRTGRALVSAVLKRRGVTKDVSVPISSGLLTDTRGYFAALAAYRGGQPDPIVQQFTEATFRAVDNSKLLLKDVEQVHMQILATAQRRTRNLSKIADLCSMYPAITAAMVVEMGIPVPTSYRLLDRLTEQGFLRRERSIGGVDVWTVPGITTALDAFAERAGRRSLSV